MDGCGRLSDATLSICDRYFSHVASRYLSVEANPEKFCLNIDFVPQSPAFSFHLIFLAKVML